MEEARLIVNGQKLATDALLDPKKGIVYVATAGSRDGARRSERVGQHKQNSQLDRKGKVSVSPGSPRAFYFGQTASLTYIKRYSQDGCR